MPSKFSVYSDDTKCLTICLPIEFRDKVWSEEFGQVQKDVTDLIGKNNKLLIDFAKCEWIDPLPLLSLFLLLKQIQNSGGIFIIASFSNTGFLNRRVLAFLSSEGYLDELEKLANDCQINGKEMTFAILKQIANANTSYLIYKDAVIIPPRVIQLDCEEKDSGDIIKKLVDSLLQESKHRFEKKMAFSHFKKIISSTRLLLTESISNVFDHAYPNSSIKLLGLYVRFRQGMADSALSGNLKSRLSTNISIAHREIPRMDRYFIDSVSGFVEFFIIDNGIGISKSYFDNSLEYQNKRYPFRDAWEEIFGLGNRNPKIKKPTRHGGLFIISRIIRKGYLIAKDQFEWMGEPLPIVKQSNAASIINVTSNHLTGFAMIARIAWQTGSERNKNWINIDSVFGKLQQHQKHPYLRAIENKSDIYHYYLKKKYKNLSSNVFFIKDDRFPKNTFDIPKNYLENAESENFIMWLPKEGLSKYEIHTIVDSRFYNIKNPSKTLLICDIADYEIDVFQFALERADFGVEFIKKFEKIILISRNISILFLTKKENNGTVKYEINKDAAAEFMITNISNFDPSTSLVNVLEWLRTHDSMLFWRSILKRENRKDFFVNGDIIWYSENQEYKLKSYFNFSQTLSDSIALELYDYSINRTICLSNDKGFAFEGNDNMTKKIADLANSKDFEKFSTDGTLIELGSVYVTGNTHGNFSPTNSSFSNSYSIHFFYNQSAQLKKEEVLVNHLFLWPDLKFIDIIVEKTTFPFRRVGNLPVIAPNGWKYYTVPRYIHKNEKLSTIPISELPKVELKDDKNFVSITACRPTESYIEWQSNDLITIGHFENDSYHDLFKINIPFAFDESWVLQSNMCLFIISQFMQALGQEVDDLKIIDTNLKTKLTRYLLTNEVNISINQANGFIVYPYHYSTDHIIKKIKTLFKENVSNKILPLLDISKNSSNANAPYLISFQTMQNIKHLTIASENSGSKDYTYILLFDTLKINGKIEREIKHILNLCGVNNIHTLNIADRSRLPLHPSKLNSTKSYWRIDVPVLGRKDSCILCKSISKANNLKNFLSSELVTTHLKSWDDRWGKIFKHLSNVDSHGISGREVKLKNSVKKFGIFVDEDGNTKQIGGDTNKITLSNSVGMLIYASEIHAMTARDNISLELCDEEDLEPESIIEILASNLLLHNELFSKSTKLKIIKKIFVTTKNIQGDSAHTAFAILALLNEDDLDDNLIYSWCYEKTDYCVTINNLDTLLFLCYRAIKNQESQINKIPEVKRLLKSNGNHLKVYKDFHSEIYNDFGETHNTPLHTIELESKIELNNLQQGYFSLRKLNDILSNQIIYHLSESDIITTIENKKNIVEESLSQLGKLVSQFRQYEATQFSSTNENNKIYSQIIPYFRDLIAHFKLAHSNLYLPLLSNNSFGENEMIIEITRIIEYYIEYDIKISAKRSIPPNENLNIKENWIPWGKLIITEIKNILSNCVHPLKQNQSKITDPYDSSSNIDAYMWVTIHKKEHKFYLSFYNKSDKFASDVTSLVNEKRRYETMYINDLGGSLTFSDIQSVQNGVKERLLCTILELPLI